jgi:hypothetical protein
MMEGSKYDGIRPFKKGTTEILQIQKLQKCDVSKISCVIFKSD